MSVDVRAGWPRECALCLFDIITVCLQRKQRLRLPIKQVCSVSNSTADCQFIFTVLFQVVDQLLILPQ